MTGNKGFYIILTSAVVFILGVITVLYIYMRRQQKIFEDAVSEIKEEALKHLREQAKVIPITPHEDVTESKEQESPIQEITIESTENQSTIENQAEEATVINFKAQSKLGEYVSTPTTIPLTENNSKVMYATPIELKQSEPIKKRGRPKKQEEKEIQTA